MRTWMMIRRWKKGRPGIMFMYLFHLVRVQILMVEKRFICQTKIQLIKCQNLWESCWKFAGLKYEVGKARFRDIFRQLDEMKEAEQEQFDQVNQDFAGTWYGSGGIDE